MILDCSCRVTSIALREEQGLGVSDGALLSMTLTSDPVTMDHSTALCGMCACSENWDPETWSVNYNSHSSQLTVGWENYYWRCHESKCQGTLYSVCKYVLQVWEGDTGRWWEGLMLFESFFDAVRRFEILVLLKTVWVKSYQEKKISSVHGQQYTYPS